MKLQDLKNNRTDIINKIKEVGNASKIKEIMETMARMVNAEMHESGNVIDLVDEVIELNQEWEKVEVSTLWGKGCKYSTQSEYQRSCLGSKYN
jgi:hypothetical protein